MLYTEQHTRWISTATLCSERTIHFSFRTRVQLDLAVFGITVAPYPFPYNENDRATADYGSPRHQAMSAVRCSTRSDRVIGGDRHERQPFQSAPTKTSCVPSSSRLSTPRIRWDRGCLCLSSSQSPLVRGYYDDGNAERARREFPIRCVTAPQLQSRRYRAACA
jgi:hypothetical protein